MNNNQILGIMLVVLGVLMTSTAQLTDVLGPNAAKYVVSIAGLLNAMLAGIQLVVTNQVGTAKSLASIEGVTVTVAHNAPQALKDLANDPAQPNIERAKV